ncbi:MAG: elongation factor G [Candidatus Eisenbacteria bacterium]|uniref:Elongation factor G n=1 Tax=Eiseniibacteriota bacterium TaxID=2212470 RepID=A0A956LX36_UNCEI|nr:elongation factor G [Candidatus Eisenbacteria bacterium]
MSDINKVRNIGISAHIDSGKTTLTERILFYTKRIHKVHEVRGKDGVGATMDSMELERERGITIASAATHCTWQDHHVNIIDTPGHVDFTIEVERSLRVLDGAVLVLCAVAGVQSQSITVDRQMRRYNVPRIAFVNKCDRTGANPARVCDQLREKLKHNSVMMQIPIGLEHDHQGVVDLVTMKGFIFEGETGEEIKEIPIPANLQAEAEARREQLLDTVSMYHDGLMEAMLEDRVTEEMVRAAVRKATISRDITPVFMGSAYKNKGVQLLLNSVIEYLPNPTEVTNQAVRLVDEKEEHFDVRVVPDAPLLSLAFKLEVSPYGQLTYLRVYQGSLSKGDFIVNQRSRDKVKVGRLVRMHADSMEDIESTSAGDIVALFGVDCASGDTFTDGHVQASMTAIHVPEPVVSLAIKPASQKAQDNMSKALQRFTKEDPTFRTGTDEETGDTLISGMGELHLEVYVERMKREYNAEVQVGRPRVAYRETMTKKVPFDYTHKKQTGGSGQYGRIIGELSPTESGDFEFVNKVVGGNIPTEYIGSVEKGFRSCVDRGEFYGFPVAGLQVLLQDGAAHSVDSSDNAFQAAARGAFREYYVQGAPTVLEPIMKVAVEGPSEFQGDIMGTIMKRRGIILGTTEEDGFTRIEGDVPLSEMFGYATVLRSATQGKAEFTMEFSRYGIAPSEVCEELRKVWLEKRAAKK